jgi:hypothetical protein
MRIESLVTLVALAGLVEAYDGRASTPRGVRTGDPWRTFSFAT